MTNATEQKKKSWGSRIAKFVFIAIVAVVALSLVGNSIWRFSGSNEWQLVGQNKGVKIYSMKSPGTDLQKFKCTFRVRSSLSGLVTLMQDSEACKDLGCYDSRVIEKVDDNLTYSTFRYRFNKPFKPREYVVRTQIHQDPKTKEVLVAYTAALGKLPTSDCCYRVTDFNNAWRLTPAGNGEVDVEYVINQDEGGFVPDVMLNPMRPKLLFMFLPNMQKILDKEKYKTAKLGFIQEKS